MNSAIVLLATALGSAAACQGELRTLTGQYVRGDGLGEVLALQIECRGRFEYSLYSDLGLVEAASGTVTFDNGWLVFVPETFEEETSPERLVESRWWVSAWGDRVYIVAEPELLEFANAVNLGAEPRQARLGRFLFREGDHARRVAAHPGLPPSARRFLLAEPVNASVTRVFSDNTAEINAGLREGLQPGMVLSVLISGGGATDARVQAVSDETAVIEASGRVRLFEGQRVTSRQP